MKKLVIRRGGLYIAEEELDYSVTIDINKAKNFKWMWLWASKKDILTGINNRFRDQGSFWEYAKI